MLRPMVRAMLGAVPGSMPMRWALGGLLVVGACGGDDGGPPIEPLTDGRACETVVAAHPLAPGVHVEQCSQVVYATNPPTSGSHYPSWAAFQAYPTRIGRPFWVHDLEHGAVVVTYNCPGGCDAEVAALEQYLASRSADSTCTAPVRNRFVVTPDPELDTRFAASAWGFSLRSSCFDLPALATFIDDHYGRGPEDFCTQGINPLTAGLPPNCP